MDRIKRFLNVILLILVCSIPVQASDINPAPKVDEQELSKLLQDTIISNTEYKEEIFDGDIKKYRVKASIHKKTYDGREEQTVTSIKNQLPYGLCWSYAAVSTAESSLIASGMSDASIDLSELQYSYIQWKTKYPDDTYETAFDQGGSITDVWEYMRQGIGPYQESDFGTPQNYKGQDIAKELIYKHLFDLESLYYAMPGVGGSAVKELISKYGGVSAVYYSSNRYYESNPVSANDKQYNNTGDVSYYYPGKISMINHMVEIVGWDDNYPKENFVKTPAGNGAWLVKNSWGKQYLGDFPNNMEQYLTDQSEDLAEPTGYYWISYYDGSIQSCPMVAVSFSDADTMPKEIKTNEVPILKAGTTFDMQAKVTPENAGQDLTYTSSDSNVVAVSESGVLTTHRAGTATITIKTNQLYDTVTKEAYLTKEIPVTVSDLSFDKEQVILSNMDKYQLTYLFSGDDKLTFISQNPEIVSVDDKGLITPKKYGKTTITVKAGDVSDTCEVYVCLDTIDDYSFSVRYVDGLPYKILPSVNGVACDIPFRLSCEDKSVEISNNLVMLHNPGTYQISIECTDDIITMGQAIRGIVTLTAQEISLPEKLETNTGKSLPVAIPDYSGVTAYDNLVPVGVVSDNTPVCTDSTLSAENPAIATITGHTINAIQSGSTNIIYRQTLTQNGISITDERYIPLMVYSDKGCQEPSVIEDKDRITPQTGQSSSATVSKDVSVIPGTLRIIPEETKYIYNGRKRCPVITIKLADGTRYTDFTVSYQNNKQVGTAMAVIHFNGQYAGMADEVVYFTIIPKKSRITKTGNHVRAKKIKGASGYEFQFAADKKFQKNTVSKKSRSNYIKAASGKYVRVRVYKIVHGKKYYSKWSGYRKL